MDMVLELGELLKMHGVVLVLTILRTIMFGEFEMIGLLEA